MQDKENVLYPGATDSEGRIFFEVTLPVKPDKSAHPIFMGKLVHGSPKERFLYLSWRNANGAYAQRLKLPLAGIGWSEIEKANGEPLLGEVAPSQKPRVPGGTNIGGTRAVRWSTPKRRIALEPLLMELPRTAARGFEHLAVRIACLRLLSRLLPFTRARGS